MFRIDRALVNLAGSQTANTDGSAAGAEELNASSNAPASAEIKALAQEILENAEQEASDILEDARREAEAMLQSARDELEELRERAWQAGYGDGAEEANTRLEEKLREDDELLRSLLREIHGERAQMLGEIEDELISLSLGVAKKIIKLAGDSDDSVFQSVIARALSQMELEGKLVIRVGAAEYSRFFRSGSAVFDLGDGVTVTASVIKDATLGEGDCIIDTENETVNAGIDSQLKLIKLAFDKADQI